MCTNTRVNIFRFGDWIFCGRHAIMKETIRIVTKGKVYSIMNFHEQAVELVKKMTLDEKISQLRYDAPAIEKLHIPAYNWWNEGLHGVARSGTATVFPQAIGMAASFDPDLLWCVADAISTEARAKYNGYKQFGSTGIYQGLTYWSPNINIFRDPRWGRGHETYGEDPYLTGVMGCAFIEGLQGDDPTYRKLDATIKHFAVHSGPESTRHEADVEIDRETMDDTYLWAFRYCIEHADPSAVMGAYNRINGEPCCGSETLLKKILRDEWDYRGYVVSDCGAINDINENHHVTFTQAESAALAVNNGCILNCGAAFRSLGQAVEEGLITEETITNACVKLFEARFRLGMFADDCPFDKIGMDVIECDAHRTINRRMAEESVVLLKNDGILPLKKEIKKLAVIGPNADDVSVLLGNYNGYPSRYSTFLRGLQDAFDGEIIYSKGCHPFIDAVANPWMEDLTREAVLAAKRADAVVMFLGLNPSMEGEEGDAFNGANAGDKVDLQLPLSQKRLWKAVRGTGKPIIFVNVSGSAVDLRDQNKYASALIQCFYPGAEGGAALADILLGKVNPSGKLPVTFYWSEESLPPFEDYRMEGRTYRYLREKPLFPFGFGLSYTTFEAGEVKRGMENEITVTVRNTGDRDGMCTLLCYLRSDGRPELNRQLAAFRKTFLKKGEEKQLHLDLCPEILERFPDPDAVEILVEV